MSGQTVIITGASRGLGRATAKIAARLSANLVLNARSEGELASLEREIDAAGGHALPIAGDISQIETCQRLVARAIGKYGALDAIINNAGIIEPIAPIAEGEPGAWQQHLAVNLLGPVFLTQRALPHLRERGGQVLNVSSGAAVNVIPGWGAYCTGKAALNHFTRVLADEEPRITTIAFRPGVVDTAMQAVIRQEGEKGMPSEEHDRFVEYHTEDALLPPEKPARALAVLSLYAPNAWSGEFIQWDEARVSELVAEHPIEG